MSNDARSSDTPETLAHPKDGGVTYALLVGVDIYLNVVSLWTCANDVDLFRECLVRRVHINKDTIRCLSFSPNLFNRPLENIIRSSGEFGIDDQCSLREIIEKCIKDCPLHHIIDDELDRLFKKVSEKDNLIVMFSGHGFEVDGVSYLAPTDLIVTNNNEYKTNTAISLKDLTDRLDKCTAKFKWLIINACRVKVQGAGDGSLRNFGASGLPQIKGTVIFQSCQSKENSIADNDLGQSVFIQTLVNALDGEADYDKDGMITMRDVVNYVTNETRSASDNVQTPYCSSSSCNLEDITIICDKTEGMTPEQLTKGKELILDAERLFKLAKTRKETYMALALLVQANECVKGALGLIPENIKSNPKPGNYFREWKKLDRDIEALIQDIKTQIMEEQKGQPSQLSNQELNEKGIRLDEQGTSLGEREILNEISQSPEDLAAQMPLFIDELIEKGMLPNKKGIQADTYKKPYNTWQMNKQEIRLTKSDGQNTLHTKERSQPLDEGNIQPRKDSDDNTKDRDNQIDPDSEPPLNEDDV